MAIPEYAPVHKIAIESREICNEPCGFCFATFQTPADVVAEALQRTPDLDVHSTLTTEELKRNVIDPFREMGGVMVHFTGGDPFLRKDLPELVDYADDKGLLVSLDTNCLIVTQPQNAELYRRVIPKLYRVGIPLDAPDESLQIQMRGHRRSYQAPLRFLEIAQELAPTVPKFPEIKVNTLLTAKNYQRVPEMVDLLEPYIRSGLVGRWSLDKFLPMERGSANRSAYQLDDANYQQTVSAVRGKLTEKGLPDIITGDQDKTNITLLVSPQGFVYVPSGNEKHFVPNSLRNTPLREVINSSILASRERQYRGTLGGTRGKHTYRHPEWEAKIVSFPRK